MSLNALDNVWSQDTVPLKKSKTTKIIDAYISGDSSTLEFENDEIIKPALYDFKENVLVVGLSFGGASYDEELSNTKGSSSTSHSAYSTKFTIGKNFTMWNEEYTQPTRLYFTYAFTALDTDVDFTTWTIGIRENMDYWSLYKTSTYKIYPTVAFEVGQSSISRETYSISGLTTDFSIGLTYSRDDNFEYFINLFNENIIWQHPIEGIADEMRGFGLRTGVNYKLNYGDF